MADRILFSAGEKVMLLVVAICVLAMLAVIAMHLGIVPGCKATGICG